MNKRKRKVIGRVRFNDGGKHPVIVEMTRDGVRVKRLYSQEAPVIPFKDLVPFAEGTMELPLFLKFTRSPGTTKIAIGADEPPPQT